MPIGEWSNENKPMLRGKERKKNKETIGMQSKIEVDEEYLYTLKINCKGKRTVGKGNEGIHVGKI